MGKAELNPAKIPVDLPGDKIICHPATIGNKEYNITCVATGNPHCVVFVDNVDKLDLQQIGPQFENSPLFPERVNYVGRLDKDSTGLLLLTNDGDLANEIQRSRNNHEKEYHVRVNTDITEDFIKKMSEGVEILDTVTKPCKVKKTGTRNFSIILTQGLNRQIRRMCDALHVRVVHLKRVRIMNIRLGSLRPGEFRTLTRGEEQELRRLVQKRS